MRALTQSIPAGALRCWVTAMVLALVTGAGAAQVPFATTPNWISTDLPNHSTGAAWADINRDGWPDLVIANGNDMGRERVVVYYNAGTGTLPTAPNWQSSDVDYHGQVAVGDVNGDGYPDIAVSVYIGPGGFNTKGKVKLYLNNGGVLSNTPSWVSKDSMYTFSCAFGDANGDGYPELAVAAGESYYSRPEKNRIYFNHNGQLDSLPGWKSSQAQYSYDVTWADFDNDGRLDLVFACEQGPNRIYKNYGDSIGTVPYWSSADPSQQANSLFTGDVNNDGYLDLAISDNNQLGGTGKFKIYLNNSGTMSTTPFWSSAFSGANSGINLADVDLDGYCDLVTGGWWQPCRIYLNQQGSFTPDPQWTSNTGSVVEAIVFADYDGLGLDTVDASFTGDGIRKLFYVPNPPLQAIHLVTAGSDTLIPGQYCFDLENGWVSCAVAPAAGVQLTVRAVVSSHLDFAVSNWDANIGNYLFKNTSIPVAVAENPEVPANFELMQNYPNPFNPTTTISFDIPVGTYGPASPAGRRTSLQVYDLLGREVATLVNEVKEPGRYTVSFDAVGLASGVYYYRLKADTFTATKKLLLLR